MSPYEMWSRELHQSDRAPKTKERYRQIVAAYRTWLKGQDPDIPSAKDYIAYLRDRKL